MSVARPETSGKPRTGPRAALSALGQLRKEPYRFEFFQAVRLLHLHAFAEAEEKGRSRHFPVGQDYRPDQEAVRIRALASHSFPPATVHTILQRENVPPEMVVTFMGLFGPSGVLPQHYTRMVIDRVRAKDLSMRDFFDIFNHRAVSYFYRAWEKHHFAIAYESAVRQGRDDPYSLGLYSVVGLGTPGVRGRLGFDDQEILFFAGQMARHPASAVSLERMVADYLGLATEVQQFVGQWLALSPDSQTSLPNAQFGNGLNCQLGVTAIAGERVWSIESKFRVRIGPLRLAQFKRLTPMGDRLPRLAQFIRQYVGRELDFDVQLVLQREEVPMCQLGGDPASGARLGWTTWIRNEAMARDADEAVFVSEGLPSL